MDGKGKGIAIAFLAIAIAFALALLLSRPSSRPASLTVNNETYGITAYAYTPAQQEKGLMNATVANSTIMLFGFPSLGTYSFWMKDTYAPLDIIWLDYNQSSRSAVVVYVVNAIPCIEYSANQSNCRIYSPNSYSNYVLEAKSGFAGENNITEGTVIRFNYKNRALLQNA